jgi:hypothetical protein
MMVMVVVMWHAVVEAQLNRWEEGMMIGHVMVWWMMWMVVVTAVD